ncbi:CG34386 [Drosophila busckii]|uniref:CG34386 n=1 Tax=Drosophila busckii TaxID=30019 RepID=A0A0M4EFK5_DROBS|nr:CG34386 [Drosophila busckii]
MLLLLAIVAARFDGTAKRTLAAACEQSNNGYTNNHNDYNNNYIDGIADSSANNDNDDGSNKAAVKWQKLHGNPLGIYRQELEQLQQQLQRQEFDEDPEPATNDFLQQLSGPGVATTDVDQAMFAAQDGNSNNNNENKRQQHNVWQAAVVGKQRPLIQSEQLPYGIQNVRKRRVRSVMPPQYASASASNTEAVTYQSLCPTKRVTVKLDNGEYRPNHYVEVTCANNYAPLPARLHNYDYNYRPNELPLLRALLNERNGEKREICSATGFACIQLNRTIHLIRLNDASGCWESETRTVPSGCECMWPKHNYGDIASYHQAQKRFSHTLTNLRRSSAGNVDYTPGVGYRQLTLHSRKAKAEAEPRSRRADVLDYESY